MRTNRKLLASGLALLFVAGMGLAAGWYWGLASSPLRTTPPSPKVLLANRFILPPAQFDPAEAGFGAAYWSPAVAGMQATVAFAAPIALDACLVDLPSNVSLGSDAYASCASLPGASTRWNVTAGRLSYTVPSQMDNGLSFNVLSPSGQGTVVSYGWWVNSTSGTTMFGNASQDFTVPAAFIRRPATVGQYVQLPSGYDRVGVQGWASGSVDVAFGDFVQFQLGDFIPSVVASTRSWNWTGSYQGAQDSVVVVSGRALVPTNVTLAVLVFDA